MRHTPDTIPSFVDNLARRPALGASAAFRQFLLTGEEEHHVAISDAARLTANARAMARPDAVNAFIYGRRVLDRMLAQSACVGIRAYYGLHPNGMPTFVLSGVKPDGADIVDGVLAQDPVLRPAWCGAANVLNTGGRVEDLESIRPEVLLTGAENSGVTPAEASRSTRLYRITRISGSLKAHFFGRAIAEEVLGQAGCVGLRLYRAREENGRRTLVLVGVDELGNDLVSGILGEHVLDCPPWCSEVNSLNG